MQVIITTFQGFNKMKINFEKTLERCKIIKISVLSRQCNVSAVIIFHILHNQYPYMNSAAAHRVFDRLRELNMLVEEPDDDDAKIAA